MTGTAIASVLHAGGSSSTSAGVGNGILSCKDSSLGWQGDVTGVTDPSSCNHKLLWRAVRDPNRARQTLCSLAKCHQGQDVSHGDKPAPASQPAGSGHT